MTVPLVNADVDLRDFAYLPLDVVRLRDSRLAARASSEEFRCAVLLWCASWHQLPAASLPDDDVELASLAGFGRSVKEWLKYKSGALHGWIKCDDGRFYHPVVAEKANEAWESKLRQRNRTSAARAARMSQNAQTHKSDTVTKSVTDNVTDDKKPLSHHPRDRDRDRDSSSETKVSGASAPADNQKSELYQRGKDILGETGGGMITKLLKAKGDNIARARAALEESSQAGDPREYIGAIIRNRNHKTEQELRDAGEIW